REPDAIYKYVRLPNGEERTLTSEEQANPELIPAGAKLFALDNLTSQRPPGDFPVEFNGKTYRPGKGYWKTGETGMKALAQAGRLGVSGSTLRYKRFIDDFPAKDVSNLWTDTSTGSFTESKVY